MVDLLHELFHNAMATYRLTGYYWITTCVGLVAVLLL